MGDRKVMSRLNLLWDGQSMYLRTGWHGEGGKGPRRRGHLTVDWILWDGRHLTTHHVYACDEAY